MGLATAAALSLAPIASDASVINVSDNIFIGSLSPAETIASPIDLADGDFSFSGVTGGATGGLSFSIFNSGAVPMSSGALQLLLTSTSGISIDTLSFAGVNLLPLTPVIGGFATAFSANLPQTSPGVDFILAFSSAKDGDTVQITLAPVPLPAGGLLLLTALGGLAVARRRRKAA